MAYKSYPWHCSICNRDFHGALGKTSHYRGKQHKANLETLRQSKKAGEK